MYYLPIHINSRKLIITHLSNKDAQEFQNNYVIEVADNYESTVLEFINGKKFCSSLGFDFDVNLFDCSCNFKFINQDLKLIFNAQESYKIADKTASNGFFVEKNENFIRISIQGKTLKSQKIIIEFIDKNGNPYQTELQFFFSENKNIYDVVFDFGSEASQVKYRKRNQYNPEFINLVNTTYQDFYKEKIRKTTVDNFFQFERENENLIKSNFFVKNQVQKNDLLKAPFTEKKESFIKILGEKNDEAFNTTLEENKHSLLPNLKLIHFGNICNFDINYEGINIEFIDIKNEINRNLLNQFMHVILSKIKTIELAKNKFSNKKSQAINLSFTLLIPNIYSQEKLFELKKSLYEDLNKIIQVDFKNIFEGLEINCISESDASFLGWISSKKNTDTNKFKLNKNYLIIDGGKGTTDLSIVKSGMNKDEYRSIYRTGFAGAGNMITFAFIDTFIALIFGNDNNLKNKFYKNILNDSTAEKLQFLYLIERIKKNHQEGKKLEFDKIRHFSDEDFKLVNGIEAFKLKNLITILEDYFDKNDHSIQDYFGIINKTVNELVHEIIKEIKKSKINKFEAVILTGRTFMFKPLEKKLKQKLEKEFGIKNIIFSPEHAKSLCLNGPFSSAYGINQNSDLVGIPVTKEGLIKELTEKIKVLSKNQFFKKIGDFFEGEEDDSETIDKNESKEKKETGSKNKSSNFYYAGLNLNLEKEELFISGNEYQAHSIKSETGFYNILFVGNGFLARTKNASVFLRKSNEDMGNPFANSFLWRSLFPIMASNKVDKIPMADLNEFFEKNPEFKKYYSGNKNHLDWEEKIDDLI